MLSQRTFGDDDVELDRGVAGEPVLPGVSQADHHVLLVRGPASVFRRG
ncbi:MAG: hypothetical protein ACRDRH_23920 [Pseudonocardia sp.]